MALTLDNTVAGTDTTNSYVDVSYCDDYWADHWSTIRAAQWAALSTAQKTTLLINACRVVETLRFTYDEVAYYDYELAYDARLGKILAVNQDQLPVRSAYYQKLQFPRNFDRDLTTGALYIPEPVKMAQCEQAGYMLGMDETFISNGLQGLVSDQARVGELSYHQVFRPGSGSMIAPAALEYVKPFLLKTSTRLRRA